MPQGPVLGVPAPHLFPVKQRFGSLQEITARNEEEVGVSLPCPSISGCQIAGHTAQNTTGTHRFSP